MTWKYRATGCTATPPPAGGPPVSVSKVTLSGSVVLPNGDTCAGFADGSAIVGSVTYKPQTPSGSAKLSDRTPGEINWGDFSQSVSGTSFSMLVPAVQTPGTQLPAVQVSGPFAGQTAGPPRDW